MFAMGALKTGEAAALLHVSPNALRAWERRFGYPMESALALRCMERSVEEVLLPALGAISERYGSGGAPWASAARWADGWLRRAQRLAPPPIHGRAILVGDATRDELDPDALAVRALELFCGRSGARVMVLPVGGASGLSAVAGSLSPDAVVIAGGHAPDDDVALWAYHVRAAALPLPMALFRRQPRGANVLTTGTRLLPDMPFGAQRELLALIDERLPSRVEEIAALPVRDGDHERREAQA